MSSKAPEITIGRLAPSPTGAQHVGNARTYLLAWLASRFDDGKVYLRIEDIDSPRIKPWAIDQAIADIQWLGLDWDPFSPDEANWIQTARTETYQEYLDLLIKTGKVYPCVCTRKDIQQAASAPHETADAVRYPDICRTVAHSSGSLEKYAWRFLTDNQQKGFHDGILGAKHCEVHKILGDFVIAKSDGTYSYQLAATIDDHLMGVNQIIRGDDLVQSTYRQLCLLENFGWQPPSYFHVPLVIGPDGRRLAKRHGDTRLSLLQQKGKSSAPLVGLLAFSLGFQETPKPVTARELLATLQENYPAFPWKIIPKDPFVLYPATWTDLLNN